jgi:hypothetical protein
MSQSVEARLSGLKNLPELEPPAGLEATTLAAMAAAGEERNRLPLGQAAAWLALAVTGLLVAAIAFDGGESGDRRSASTLESGDSVVPANADASSQVFDEGDFVALLAQSTYLEQVLAALPQRQVMRFSTAGTIAGLEQQIAQIDEALWTPNARVSAPEYRVALMRDRIETMNALLNVRYSQSRAFSY